MIITQSMPTMTDLESTELLTISLDQKKLAQVITNHRSSENRPKIPQGARSRRDRPCDACRRRKSRCVINSESATCVLCQFHSQECTFVQSPQPRKRRLVNPESVEDDESQELTRKRTKSLDQTEYTYAKRKDSASEVVLKMENVPATLESNDSAGTEEANSSKESLGLYTDHFSTLIGPTSEFEAALINLCPFNKQDEYKSTHPSNEKTIRRVMDMTTFLVLPSPRSAERPSSIENIEKIVAPHGQLLLELYFKSIHPSFPLLEKSSFLAEYTEKRHEMAPHLLAAVYILAVSWCSQDSKLSSKSLPDVEDLSSIAFKSLKNAFDRPNLSTIQAGLLLLQKSAEDSWVLNCQLVAVAQELGLHLDCTSWRIPSWEFRLRKRLAWAIFMQDKWAASTHGRPSHISSSNWAVPSLTLSDFPDITSEGLTLEETTDLHDGSMLFIEMVELSKITAEVLEEFFTVDKMNRGGLQDESSCVERVLERAKPIQLKLKEWYTKLPTCLRMDYAKETGTISNGYLHLAYFATEITLHRSIIRSLKESTNPYLVHICRTAAKTRLISAMDFVNRLKPEHLQSFWYFASRKNFGIIGTFGSLLWATSQVSIESEFYKARLDEYRWTLRVSREQAPFLDYAIQTLDMIFSYCMEGVDTRSQNDDEELDALSMSQNASELYNDAVGDVAQHSVQSYPRSMYSSTTSMS